MKNINLTKKHYEKRKTRQRNKMEITKIIKDFDANRIDWNTAKEKLCKVESSYIKNRTEYGIKVIEADRRRSEEFKHLFVGGGMFLFGVVGLFFEASRSIAPFLLGFSLVFVGRYIRF